MTRRTFPKGYISAVTLGSGGMARVYRARQRHLDRDVAIKMLLPRYARDPAIRARFEREARYAAGLQHEGIVPIYDFIKEGGTAYMVMEYVDGIDLREILQSLGTLPPQVAALIGLRVIRALEYAHRRGIVHRDIKPGNVLISRRGEVKLTDFGIAKNPSDPADDLTRTGTAVGTPMYMSPEQVLGEDIDFRSDVFSFGILLYEMLSGERPFKGESEGKVLKAISSGTYVDIRQVSRRTPWTLARIVRRCLRRDPRKRFQETEELQRRIGKYVYRQIGGSLEDHLAVYLNRAGLFDTPATRVVQERDDADSEEEASADSHAPAWTVPPPLSWRARLFWAAAAAAPALLLLAWPHDIGHSPDEEHASPTATATATPTPTDESQDEAGGGE